MDSIEELGVQRKLICEVIDQTSNQISRLFDEIKSRGVSFSKLPLKEQRKIKMSVSDLKKTAEEIDRMVDQRKDFCILESTDLLSDIKNACKTPKPKTA